MLQPARFKYRKMQKGRYKGVEQNLNMLHFGKYGIQTITSAVISARMIETVRRTLTRCFKRKGQIWIRVFPSVAVSRKPAEVRMGKGKGATAFWVARLKAGQTLFEMDGVSFDSAVLATKLANQKLPFAIHLVTKNTTKL